MTSEPKWPAWVDVSRDVHDMTADPRPRCAVCGRVCAVGFVAPDDLWRAAAGEYEHDHLCIACFDERVPADWPVQWESVTTLWPVSRKRALTDLAEHDHRQYMSRSTCPICIQTVAEARAAAERDVAAARKVVSDLFGSVAGAPERALAFLATPAAEASELAAEQAEADSERWRIEEWHAANPAAEPRWPSGPDFVFERLENLEAVRMSIRDCEGQHVQQVVYSTYHDALTQVCFTERKVRCNVDLAALQEKEADR